MAGNRDFTAVLARRDPYAALLFTPTPTATLRTAAELTTSHPQQKDPVAFLVYYPDPTGGKSSPFLEGGAPGDPGL